MRILYFTFIVPTIKFGGGIGVIQSISSLCQNAIVDYIGPTFDEKEFIGYPIHLNNITIVNKNENILKRFYNFIFKGITTGFYDSWVDVIKTVDIEQYDCIYLDYSRQDFVAKWTKKKGLPLVIRVHNVEAEYFKTLYKKKKNFVNWIKTITSKKSEKFCVQLADKVVALTSYDKAKLIEIYNIPDEKIEIMPVCVKNETSKLSINRSKPYILIAGSLWFGPNAEGTEWFLDKVWRALDESIGEEYDLLVVGANPNQRLQKLASGYKHVFLYVNPEDIKPFYQEAELFIAPIFYGAGMKVKIAEALACSLPVVATPHALIGYEAVYSHIYSTETKEEFENAIKHYLEKDDLIKKKMKQELKNLFENNYSMNSCRNIMRNILQKVVE